MVESSRSVALLAPVPRRHLDSGVEVLRREGRVAFGSRAWELFRKLDDLRCGEPVDVYIYASHEDGNAEVSWLARYVRSVESQDGAHPEGMRLRPLTTASNESDNLGHWAVFWELDELRCLEPHERHPMTDFTPFGKRKAYGKSFVPEGPLLIEHP